MKFRLKLVCCLAASSFMFSAFPVQAGWIQTNSDWIYQTDSGALATGWLYQGQTWYYLHPDGIMATGWQKVDGKWYYFFSWGGMATNWQYIEGNWYWFGSDGAMKTGWLLYKNDWYYLASDGTMVKGWQSIGGITYYFTDNGDMCTGSCIINDAAYQFSQDGALLATSSAIEQDFLRLVNQYRRQNGREELVLSASLTQAAQIRAEEISRTFSHTRPDGKQWYTVLEDRGIHTSSCGENIAYNYDTPEEAMQGWTHSQSHREIILTESYQYFGAACFRDSAGSCYWVQLFSDSIS